MAQAGREDVRSLVGVKVRARCWLQACKVPQLTRWEMVFSEVQEVDCGSEGCDLQNDGCRGRNDDEEEEAAEQKEWRA